MAFVLKSVNPSTHVGADLQDLRRRSRLTIEDVSRQTKIPESFVSALEDEHWDAIGDPAYAERMLKAYVEFLGGHVPYFLKKYRACLTQLNRRHQTPHGLPFVQRLRLLDLAVLSRLIAFGGFLLFAGALGAYVYLQARVIQTPPTLAILEPIDGQRLDQPFVRVAGKTMVEASVIVNGQPTVVQQDGTFFLDLDVPRGTTMITITAKKRHGENAVAIRRVVYDQPLPNQPTSFTR